MNIFFPNRLVAVASVVAALLWAETITRAQPPQIETPQIDVQSPDLPGDVDSGEGHNDHEGPDHGGPDHEGHDHEGHDHEGHDHDASASPQIDGSRMRDDEKVIQDALSQMPPEVAEQALQAREAFKKSADQLAENMIRLREMHVRFVNGIDNSTADAKAFRELRLEVAEQFETHFDVALNLFRFLPSSEAASFLVTMLQVHFEQDSYDQESFEAAARLIDVGQQLQYLYLMAGRAGLANGEFETAKQIYQALQENEIPETDQRLFMQSESIEKQYIAEQERLAATEPDSRPQVRIVTTQGDVLVELFAESAPSTVGHFLKLVESGFYDGMDFSQVMSGLLALTGDRSGDGRGNSGQFLIDEHNAPNAHHALRGSLIMAKIPLGAGEFIENSGSSQFAITFLPLPTASINQTVFGRVIEGMDAVSRLRRVDPTKEASKKGMQMPPDSIIRIEIVRDAKDLPPPNYVDIRAMMEQAAAASKP